MERLTHGERTLFEGLLAAEHRLDFVDQRVLRFADQRHLRGHSLQETVLVEGIDQVFHQLAESLFGAAFLGELFQLLLRAGPQQQLVAQLVLKTLPVILDGAVPFVVRIVRGGIQILERGVLVHGAVLQVLLIVDIAAVGTVQKLAIAHGAVLERGIVRRIVIVEIVGTVVLEFRPRIRKFVIVDFALIHRRGIVQFQKRVAFQFFLDRRVELQGIFLQDGYELP